MISLNRKILRKVIVVLLVIWVLLCVFYINSARQVYLYDRAKTVDRYQDQLNKEFISLKNESELILLNILGLTQIRIQDQSHDDFAKATNSAIIGDIWNTIKDQNPGIVLHYYHQEEIIKYDFLQSLGVVLNRSKLVFDNQLLNNNQQADLYNDSAIKVYLSCESICYLNVLKALLPYNNDTGLLQLSMPLDRLIIKFASMNDLILSTYVERAVDSEHVLTIEKKIYTLNETSDASILTSVGRQDKDFKIAERYFIDSGSQVSEEFLLRQNEVSSRVGMVFHFKEDVSEVYRYYQKNVLWLIMLSLLAVILTIVLLYFSLRSTIHRLKSIYRLIPLIGTNQYDSKYNYSKASFTPLTGLRKKYDEIDGIHHATVDLNDTLQTLHGEVKRNHQNLLDSFADVSRQHQFIDEVLNTADAIIITSTIDYKITSVNRFTQDLFGHFKHVQNDIEQQDVARLLGIDRTLLPNLSEKHSQHKDEFYLELDNGQPALFFSWTFRYIPKLDQVLIVGNDITDRKQSEKKIKQLAEYDYLTELFNRRKSYELIEQMILRDREKSFSLLFIDIDNFKALNDEFGHGYGNVILKAVALCLKNICEHDGFVGRIGGDEFLMVLNQTYPKYLADFCEQLLQQIAHLPNEGRQHDRSRKLTLSIGISCYPENGDDLDRLLSRADAAMYENKATRDGSYHFYSGNEKMIVERNEQTAWSQLIDAAIRQNKITCFFHPVVDIEDASVERYEVLARVFNQKGDLINNAVDFIRYCEKNHRIVTVDRIVFETGLRKGKACTRAIDLLFNFSIESLCSNDFAEFIIAKANDIGFPLTSVILEITESELIDDFSLIKQRLQLLKYHGVRVALDDYGVGYTSLDYLIRLPIDYLKLDKSFTQLLVSDQRSLTVAQSVFKLANALDINIIAEGIETAEAYKLLADNGVTLMQGYYFALPQPQPLPASLLESQRERLH